MSQRIVIAGDLQFTMPDLQEDATQIVTSKGPIDRSRLTIKEVTQRHPHSVAFATEWYLGDELVRRDVHVNKL